MIPDDGFQLTDDHYRDDRLRLLAALAALPIDRVALVVAPDVPTMAMLRTVTRAHLDQAHRIVWTTVEAAARSVFRGSDPGDVFIDPACAAAANMLPPRLARQYDEALAVLTALGSLGWPRSCPNCDHPAHDGLACTCTTDDSPPAPCACSWPTPDNFTNPTYWLPPGAWIGADVDDAGALTVVAAQVQPDGRFAFRSIDVSTIVRRLCEHPPGWIRDAGQIVIPDGPHHTGTPGFHHFDGACAICHADVNVDALTALVAAVLALLQQP